MSCICHQHHKMQSAINCFKYLNLWGDHNCHGHWYKLRVSRNRRKFVSLFTVKCHEVNCVNYLVVRESSDYIELASFSQDMKGHAKTPNDFDCQHFRTVAVDWIIWFIYTCDVINDFGLWLFQPSWLSDMILGGSWLSLSFDLIKQNYLIQ